MTLILRSPAHIVEDQVCYPKEVMITPKLFKESDTEVMHQLIRAHPLGTWATNSGGLDINHIPFVLDSDAGEYGTLKAHVNRANPVWKSLEQNENSIVVFQGADAYISPSWYASKQEHGKVVPTWNYVVVHAHGVPRAVHEIEWLLEHLNQLTDEQESDYQQPWKVSDAPDNFTEKMLKGIVGIEIPIDELFGTWKASQNKTQADSEGVIHGLGNSVDQRSRTMVTIVARGANNS